MTGAPIRRKKPLARTPVPVGSFMLRRVFRQGEGYFCGICRQKHTSVDEANRCLETCWKAVLHRAPWSPVKRIGKYEFACIYCQRGYATSQLATICAEECASRMSIASLDGRDLSPVHIKRTFAKQDFKMAGNFPFSRPGHPIDRKVDDPVEPPPDTTDDPTADETPPDAEASANATAEEAAKNTSQDPRKNKNFRDRGKKFERNGSKYECLVCHKLYYEKVEVERCFDSHSGGSMEAHQNSGV